MKKIKLQETRDLYLLSMFLYLDSWRSKIHFWEHCKLIKDQFWMPLINLFLGIDYSADCTLCDEGQSNVFFFHRCVFSESIFLKCLRKLTIYEVRWYCLLSTTLQVKIYNNNYLINGLCFNFHGWFILIWIFIFSLSIKK